MATKQENPLEDAIVVFLLLAGVAFMLLTFSAAQLP
jgi:hypothetical protein